MDGQMFGDKDSPLRESPQFRESMEKYIVFKKLVDELNARRGYLTYEEMNELEKLKKLKLAEKDRMEIWKSHILIA